MNTLKNIAKKAIAVSSGALVMASTIGAAYAASLSEYPAPFVANGQFNGLIVVGEKAMTSDVLGSIEIASSLQAQSTSVVTGGAATSVLGGDSKKIGESSDMLEIGEDFGSVTETLTEDDLQFLKSGSISTDNGDTDFVQTIDLDLVRTGTSGSVGLYEDNSDKTGTFLFFNDGDPLFRYELEFTSGLESDVEVRQAIDLEDESLFMLGQYFSIVDSSMAADGTDFALELIAGDVTDTLREGETKSYTVNGKTYEITLLIVADNSATTTAKFLVNGEATDSMEEGDTDKAGGLDIGVREVLGNEGSESNGADLAEFYLGANKLELTDNSITDGTASTVRPKINGETIEDATLTITGTETVSSSEGTVSLSRITYTLNGDAVSGDQDLYLKKGEGIRAFLDEPQGMLADNWDIRFEGVSAPASTEINFNANGDDQYELTFTNQRNVEFTVPLFDAGAIGDDDAAFGDEDDGFVVFERNVVGDGNNADNVADFNIGIDDYFAVTEMTGAGGAADNGDVTYILQFQDVDDSEDTLTFQTAGEGKEVKARWDTGTGAAATPYAGNLTIGGKNYEFWFTTTGNLLAVDLDGDGVYGTNVATGATVSVQETVALVTKGGGIITFDGALNVFNATNDAVVLTLTTDADDMDNDVAQVATLTFTEAADEIDVNVASGAGDWFEQDPKGEDRTLYLSRYGTMIDEEDQTDSSDTVTVTYPSEQVEAIVYVTGGDVQSSMSSSSGAVRINPIGVGFSALDSEVTDSQYGTKNLIVVGGPCVNTVAAKLLDNPTKCEEGFTSGKAMLKMFDNGKRVALLVAGYGAKDTQGASRVLAQAGDYKLAGMEAELTVTSVNNVMVKNK